MPHRKRITAAVTAAMDLAPDATQAAKLRAHCEWELAATLANLEMDDLETSEILALLAVLCPVHARALPSGGAEEPTEAGGDLRVV